MFMRAVTYRIVYVGVLSLGLLAGAAFRQSTVQAAPAAGAPQAPVAAVAASRPVVTLATVEVRAKAIRQTPANAANRAAAPRVAEPIAAAGAGSSLPSLRLDMPYYSFGKLLPRVGKE